MSIFEKLGPIALTCLVATACDEPTRTPHTYEPATTAAPQPMAPAVTTLSDSQSVEALGTVNHAEVELASYALGRVRTEPARQLAQMMIDEHTQAESDIVDWANGHMVAGAANDVSPAVSASAGAVRARLAAAADDDFDRAYVQSQIDMHADALDILDRRIVPGAEDPTFRTLVTHIREAVAMHLTHARTTLSELPHHSDAVATGERAH